jgi:diacylglycerol kinase family enzyme
MRGTMQAAVDPTAAIVVNPRSGQAGEADALAHRLMAGLGERSISTRLVAFAPGGPDPDGWRRDLRRLLSEGLDRVYVLGGDGTVLAIATQLIGRGVPLGIVPLGTANLLARDLELPLVPEEVVDALLDPNIRVIDVGRVNGELFLCASMLGMTTGLAHARERGRGLGTWRLLPGMLRKAYWLLKRYPFRRVTLRFDDHLLSVSTRAMIVTNNPLRPRPGLYPGRHRLDQGILGIYGVQEGPLWELPRLALSLVAGTWPEEPRIFRRSARRVTIDTVRPYQTRALNDGEFVQLRTPLHYDLLSAALPVLVPASGDMGAADRPAAR